MRKLNILSLAMSLLSMLVIFSVGFSTWITMNPNEQNVEGGFSAYPVELMSDYVKTTQDQISVFGYSALHFWNDNKTSPSDTGKVSITYTVDVDKCKAKLGDGWNGSLTVQTNLWYENVAELDGSDSLFSAIDDGTHKRAFKVVIGGVEKTVTNTGDTVTVLHTLTGLDSGEVSFTVDYVFEIPMNNTGTTTPANFRYCLGKYLMDKENDKTTFHTTAKVTDLE